jgi:hypothetical protein
VGVAAYVMSAKKNEKGWEKRKKESKKMQYIYIQWGFSHP